MVATLSSLQPKGSIFGFNCRSKPKDIPVCPLSIGSDRRREAHA